MKKYRLFNIDHVYTKSKVLSTKNKKINNLNKKL